jgi:hypothetical protein
LVVLMLVGSCFIAAVLAQDESQPAKPAAAAAEKKPDKKAAKAAKLSAAREEELLQFVHEHHPELAELLDQLKPMSSEQYRAALRDLDRDVRRIENVRKGSSARHDVELNLWKSRSRIRLLAARLTVSSDEELRGKLRDELRQLRQLERDSVMHEITSAQQVLEKQQRKLEQLARRASELEGDDDSWVEKKLSALEREQQQQIQKNAAKKPSKSKPASKQKPEKSTVGIPGNK